VILAGILFSFGSFGKASMGPQKKLPSYKKNHLITESPDIEASGMPSRTKLQYRQIDGTIA